MSRNRLIEIVIILVGRKNFGQVEVGGHGMRRAEGASKVTGRLEFTEDQPRLGLAHASLVTSYLPSAEIRSVDAARALELPGVLAVLTAADLGLTEEGPDAP